MPLIETRGSGSAFAYGLNASSAPILTINGVNYDLTGGASIPLSTQGYYTVVPQKAMSVNLSLWGAGGGAGTGGATPSYGSAGGMTKGVISLTAFTPYILLIGQGGRKPPVVSAPTSAPTGRAFPDGGQSEQNEGYGQAGGGGSSRFGIYAQSGCDLTNSSTDYNNTSANYLLIAGAGGGGADYTYNGTLGGYGGGTSGAQGGGFYGAGESLAATGGGGTQSAGGAAGTTPARLAFAQAGSKYFGGNGSGGGGGGGYYGGGGARGYYTQGGGGSGYIAGSVTNSSFYTTSAGGSNYYTSPNPLSNRPTSTTGFGGTPGASTGTTSHGYDGGAVFTLA